MTMWYGEYRGAIISYLEFQPELLASIVRFVPRTWNVAPALNWQLYGCNTTVADDSGSSRWCNYIAL